MQPDYCLCDFATKKKERHFCCFHLNLNVLFYGNSTAEDNFKKRKNEAMTNQIFIITPFHCCAESLAASC